MSFPALFHIHQRLEAVVLSRDPLHVLGPVGAASAQWGDVVNMVARAGAASEACGGTGVLSAEGADLGAVAFYAGMGRCCKCSRKQARSYSQGVTSTAVPRQL